MDCRIIQSEPANWKYFILLCMGQCQCLDLIVIYLKIRYFFFFLYNMFAPLDVNFMYWKGKFLTQIVCLFIPLFKTFNNSNSNAFPLDFEKSHFHTTTENENRAIFLPEVSFCKLKTHETRVGTWQGRLCQLCLPVQIQGLIIDWNALTLLLLLFQIKLDLQHKERSSVF